MSEAPAASDSPASDASPEDAVTAALKGAVIVAVIPGQPARVLKEGARYAKLLGAPLLVVHVDITRFVTYEDPDGYVQSSPIDINAVPGIDDLEIVRGEASVVLEGRGLTWSLQQLVGDPALAIKHLADSVDARLIVVGTRKRGFGESVREFFTGSVAARLAHRQTHSVLVVPLGAPATDDEELWPESE